MPVRIDIVAEAMLVLIDVGGFLEATRGLGVDPAADAPHVSKASWASWSDGRFMVVSCRRRW